MSEETRAAFRTGFSPGFIRIITIVIGITGAVAGMKAEISGKADKADVIEVRAELSAHIARGDSVRVSFLYELQAIHSLLCKIPANAGDSWCMPPRGAARNP